MSDPQSDNRRAATVDEPLDDRAEAEIRTTFGGGATVFHRPPDRLRPSLRFRRR
ncbi:hypothetical protein ACF1G5_25270 [Streptomyces coeruleorubidus]|uniref:hypothetical protein n=1 Tax=Streptomyces coeruleorubidus TaxID=116188 RepID=UPI0036FCD1C5